MDKKVIKQEDGYLFEAGNDCLREGKEGPAVFFYTKAAEKQNTEAMLKLGRFYESKGKFKEAEFWFTSAMFNGNDKAYALYADMYCDHAIASDEERKEKVLHFLNEGMKAKDTTAYFLMACLYKEGNFVEKDYNKIFEILNKGIKYEGDNLGSIYCDLGVCYEYGYGCEVNDLKAVECYKKAIEKGCSRGYLNLGNYFKCGYEGQEPDYAKAFDNYHKAMLLKDELAAEHIVKLLNLKTFDAYNCDVEELYLQKGIEADSGYCYLMTAKRLIEGSGSFDKNLDEAHRCLMDFTYRKIKFTEELKEQFEELKTLVNDPDFWKDIDKNLKGGQHLC